MVKLIIIILFASSLFADSNFDAIRLEKSIKSFVEKKLGKSEVEIRALIGSQEFYDDGIKATIEFTDKEIGSTNLLMKFLKGDKVIKRYHVPVYIKVQKKVIVYSKDLSAGTILSKDDLEYKNLITDQNSNIDINLLVGFKLKRNVSENKVIEEADLEAPKVVESGQEVELVIANSNVKVTSKAKALNSASIGEKVRLERRGSNKLIEGVALQDGSVLVK